MAEENNINNQNNAADGAAPVKTDNSANASVFDPSKIGDAEFAKVFDDPRLFKHDRFKSLTEAKQELKTLREAQSKAEEEKLKANQEFEKLAQNKEKEANSWKEKATQAEISAEIVRIAASKGAVDLSAVKKLIDRGNIKLDEAGNIIGAEEAVEALTKSSPYLFNKGANTPDIGNGTNPGGANNTVKKFKLSQLSDAKFYRENYAEIQKAFKAGTVENDGGTFVQQK